MIKSSPDLHFNKMGSAVPVDGTFNNISKAIEVTGDGTHTLIPAKANTQYWVKGITILGNGNSGEIRLLGTRESVSTLLLPLYMSAQNKGNTSGALNLKLDENTSITFTTTGRSTNKTFVGVSYIEVSEVESLGYIPLLDNENNPMFTIDGKQLFVKVV
jgi:hypothetical protein